MSTGDDVQGWRIGELAAKAGVTVRALHHYDAMGLLAASGRTTGGHRVYTDEDVVRLYRIALLRQLGMPLAKIACTIDAASADVRDLLMEHLAEVDHRLASAAVVRVRVQRLLGHTTPAGPTPAPDDLLHLLAEMSMMELVVQQRISILVYADLDARVAELTDVFRLGPAEVVRDETGNAVHATVQAGDGMIWLHPESGTFGLRSPAVVGAATAMTAVMVDDVDAHFRHAQERGATIVAEPVDQPYGYREYTARDSEGGLWSFMKPLDEPGPADARM